MRRLVLALVLVALAMPGSVEARNAASQFTVDASFVPATVANGATTAFTIHTRIGADCTASMRYEGGGPEIDLGIQHVGGTGILHWTLTVHTNASGGAAAAICLTKNQDAIGIGFFTVHPAQGGVGTFLGGQPQQGGPSQSRGNVLLNISGNNPSDSKTDSDTFKVSGAFIIHYTSKPLDPSDSGGGSLFQITVRAPGDAVFDAVVNSFTEPGKLTPNGSAVLKGDDCSGGCYLEVEASNLAYTIQVTH